jgi:nitrite reductase/ring-hydroxylating ferredoxin subunit
VRHHAGSTGDFAPDSIKIVEIGARSIGVVRAGETFYAVLNVCPHALAPVCEGRLTGTMLPSAPGTVSYGLEHRILRCPWHGFEYDLENGGRTVFTTFKGRVRMFPVTVEDGQVYVEIPERAAPAAGSRTAEAQRAPAPS